ncbi:hypothetical protein TNIN_8061 [Trichonephila inaurata madagascariensis]|uniref:Uncharacterized protein n=1 Tax=Trichonephila inaurata madagascariensis TaxID=2747483 RepID=A0A8X6YNZ4_9ARAC|nr:hypothetical protein TNIN_8061 [Trichonephila inaurata madagascariensis]
MVSLAWIGECVGTRMCKKNQRHLLRVPSNRHYLLSSLNTEKSLNLTSTVRHTEDYTGSSRKKKPGLLTEGVIPLHDNGRTEVSREHVELPSLSGTNLTTRPTAQTCHPAISMRLIP